MGSGHLTANDDESSGSENRRPYDATKLPWTEKIGALVETATDKWKKASLFLSVIPWFARGNKTLFPHFPLFYKIHFRWMNVCDCLFYLPASCLIYIYALDSLMC